MDRCALFVDAGYVLADSAMADRGTSQQESAAWDYAGLIKFLTGLARDRSGLPVLRCYWYQSAAHDDAVANLPGVKLRTALGQRGRSGNAHAEMGRDIRTLARNRAVADMVIVSAREELAPVVTEVQDLGVRVFLVHLAADGNWTVPRALRQECDDIIDTPAASLRPYAERSATAQSAPGAEPYPGLSYPPAEPSRGPDRPVTAPDSQSAPAYQAVAFQQPGQSLGSAAGQQAGLLPAREHAKAVPAAPVASPVDGPARDVASTRQRHGRQELAGAGPVSQAGPPGQTERRPERLDQSAAAADREADTDAMSRQRPYPGPEDRQRPAAGPGQGQGQGTFAPGSAMQSEFTPNGLPQRELPQSGMPPGGLPQNGLPQNGLAQGSPPQSGMSRGGLPQNGLPQASPPGGLPQSGMPSSALPQNALPQNGLPVGGRGQTSMPPNGFPGGLPPGGLPQNGLPQNGLPQARHGQSVPPQDSPAANSPLAGGPLPGPLPGGPPRRPERSAPYPLAQQVPYGRADPAIREPFGPRGPGPQGQRHSAPYAADYGQPGSPPYADQQGSGPLPGQQAAAVPLGDAVQAAHAEGFGFGETVARDAPALWLEAVLARKPRMPSDLEARLLQGSALPIDSLLNDDVRHALRRGFWDALERSRR
ncbi:MAG: NYN domain-containing protein [Streptosporangiaceae bacterium]